uniref:Small ribosomal subunit protein uS14c n=1 Tax=Rhodobryum laxelimbatum TaxID=576390 RepID=A0A7T6Y9Y9_9BRYO|nr:ribosomal protein S14 [Rhodobryum laxelimbatum]QQK56287.1 ribosomal protein S14 [Rhodobryum laxelimbatum]
MAKKSLIERGRKRQRLGKKYQNSRQSIKKKIKETLSLNEKWEFQKQLQTLPRNSAPTRLRRRCFLTGRPRANYRDFGLSRHVLREMAHACFLPGLTKSSW